jgi:hypothetical protein
MQSLPKSRWSTLAVFSACAVLLLAAGQPTDAAPICKKVKGKFTLQPVSGPACVSPVPLCATGSYQGGIAGDSTFTGSSLIQTVDTPTTAVVLLTGDNVIQTADGTLLTKDAIVLRTTGAGEFAEVDTIVGGTDELAGASGVFTATGTFTSAGGEGTYRGEICVP